MKPTKEMIQKADNQQLAEWSAMWVMEWKKCLPNLYDWEWVDSGGNKKCLWSDWNPAENIGQAMLLEEKIGNLGYDIKSEYMKHLGKIVYGPHGSRGILYPFSLIHAEPKERTLASLLAISDWEVK